ncbi:MAG: TIGR01459 family HAD-type hydrolase [Proteobacteria bacterium]|nr:TIGR01459 family HAD-type hydrolase [Pseudomonadota bacterium]
MIQKTSYIDSLTPILDQYDALLIDICGVVHDGTLVFPWANETLAQLASLSKRLVLFSNSPRTTNASMRQLQKYGVDIAGAGLCTSGQYFVEQMQSRISTDQDNGNLFIVGVDKNPELAQSLVDVGAMIVDSISQAKYLVIFDNAALEGEFSRHDGVFAMGVKLGITALCPNPDTKATAGRGIMYPQGAFAKRYQNMGGSVEYFGKPMPGFYQHAKSKFTLDNMRILAVGDNMETDIEGAYNCGLDSILILGTGIYRNEDVLHSNLLAKYKFHPTYMTEKFSL